MDKNKMTPWTWIIVGTILIGIGGIMAGYGWFILPKGSGTKDVEAVRTAKQPYVRFIEELNVQFRAPIIQEIIAMLPQYFGSDSYPAGRITEEINKLNDFEKIQLCRTFRMTRIRFNLENIGESIAREIECYWDKHLFFTHESLKAGEKTHFEDWLFGNLSLSVRNKEGVASAIAPQKTLDFWIKLISKVKKMSQEGKLIASDLEVIYKVHKRKIPLLLEIVWKDLNNNSYKNVAESNLFWNGTNDQLEPWKYSLAR